MVRYIWRFYKSLFFEDLKTKPLLFMKEISNWLEIDPAIYKEANLSSENKSFNPKSKALHNLVNAINNKIEGFFRAHHSLKRYFRNLYYMFNDSNEKKEVVSNMAFKNLSSVYDPYNKKLFDMLCSRGYSAFPEWLGKDS